MKKRLVVWVFFIILSLEPSFAPGLAPGFVPALMAQPGLGAASKQTMLLDGDQVRHGLCGYLGFSPADRAENIRRVGHLAKLFYEHGNIVLCNLVSPYAKDRDAVKALFSEADFVELYV
jgi:bifunctional enzyme CysN/CysC